jgi:hypothetical protein
MSKLLLKFNTLDEVVSITLEPNINAEFFAHNLKKLQRPADRIYYTKNKNEVIEEFLIKARKAKIWFDFEWNLEDLNQDNFNLWHRDIESFDLSKYPPWTQEKGDFFIDLHASLHDTEGKILEIDSSSSKIQRRHIQIKWFYHSVDWPETPKFISYNDVGAGDIIADYPHVGKTPMTCMLQNDNSALEHSCRLPDACPASFFIHLSEQLKKIDLDKTQQQLKEWYESNRNQLEHKFSMEKMLHYDGLFRIGKIENPQHISVLQTCKLDSVTLI